ncbi:MAG: phosphate ABC transporter permease PstA [Myxococcota bacterium]
MSVSRSAVMARAATLRPTRPSFAWTGEDSLRVACATALMLPLLLLAVFFGAALLDAWPRLNLTFLTSMPSRVAEDAGILPALAGTAWLLVLTALLAIPLGVGAAVYLEEYARPGRMTRLIEVNISNLAGVPSIIYGLLALEVFVRAAGMGRSVLAGACTLALLLLPVVITATREALRTVPTTLREAALGLGAERWQVMWRVVLPMSLPGIITGVVLSLSRAVGETAPLIMVGALGYVAFVPTSVQSAFTALPIQIFNWISRPQAAFHSNAAAAMVVLLLLMLALNALAMLVRRRVQRAAAH